MRFCCGMDLNSTNTMVVVINEVGESLIERRVSNHLVSILDLLVPCGVQLSEIAVESTFN